MTDRRFARMTRLAAVAALLLPLSAGVAAADDKPAGDPYPLATCPISGGKLGSMGDPVVKTYEGREVKFCCAGCLPTFEKDLAASFAKLDEAIIKAQKKTYPLDTCIVMEGEPLSGPDATPFDWVHNNRLVRFCCKRCARKFRENPDDYLAKLDATIVKKQLPAYPLETCVVSGQKLGSMGEPVNVVLANRLVRLCCAGCKESLRSDPLAAFAKLDKAMAAAGSAAAVEMRTISFQGVSTGMPAAWEEFPPTSNMRELNARIADEDGRDAAELVVYYFGTSGAGPVDANIDRWAAQFRTEDGRAAEAKRWDITVDGMAVALCEMKGAYVGMGQADATEGQAALCAIVDGPAGPLYFKLVGDEDVIEASRDAFMAMVKKLQRDAS